MTNEQRLQLAEWLGLEERDDYLFVSAKLSAPRKDHWNTVFSNDHWSNAFFIEGVEGYWKYNYSKDNWGDQAGKPISNVADVATLDQELIYDCNRFINKFQKYLEEITNE